MEIKINDKTVFYNDLVHPDFFSDLYLKERVKDNFTTKIILGDRPFATFLAKDRKGLYKEGDILLIRISKKNKQVQFISKIYKWGKIHVPKRYSEYLDLNNHEEINVNVINKDQILKFNKNKYIDLAKVDAKIIPRGNKYITIYSKGKTAITLPRYIDISPELIELIFLIHGDGHYQNKFYFVSKTPELIDFVLEYFDKILMIPRSIWRARIIISNSNKNNNPGEFWKGKLKLTDNQFYNTSITSFNTSQFGNLRIIIDKTIVSVIYKYILELLLKYDTGNLYSLNGLLCAEGGAQLENHSLHRITLSFNIKEKNMFKDILDNLKLEYVISQNKTFIIQGWNNLYFFFKLFFFNKVVPFTHHTQRRNNAINGFLYHSFTKTMKKYLSIILENDKITIKRLSQILNILQDSISETINKKQYQDFMNIEGKGIRGNPFILSITKEGNQLLNLIKLMEVKQCEFK